jgi:hypothetical protein
MRRCLMLRGIKLLLLLLLLLLWASVHATPLVQRGVESRWHDPRQ